MHFTAKSHKRRHASSGTGLHHPLLTGWAGLASAVVLMPILAIAWLAVSGGTADWPHLIENVIPRATGRTLLLVLFTGTATAMIGIVTAWLVATYEFPLRRFLSAALVLPLAIPAYLSAYAFGSCSPSPALCRAWCGPSSDFRRAAITGFPTCVPSAAPCSF